MVLSSRSRLVGGHVFTVKEVWRFVFKVKVIWRVMCSRSRLISGHPLKIKVCLVVRSRGEG